MRLTCPNCNAQYEVDDAVIPRAGRDVQCSACGNTWLQYPREVALQMREAELDEDDGAEADQGASPPSDPETSEVRAALRDPERAQRIDKSVLDVLREEADRELEERRRSHSGSETGGLETQGDLGLSRPTRSQTSTRRALLDDEQTAPETAPDEAPAQQEPASAPGRRNLLPDIEELSSTLAPGASDGNTPDALEDLTNAASPSASSRGFGKGLTVVMLVALAFVMVYVFAPLIASLVPSLRPTLVTYVGMIDSARESVGAMLRGLLNG